MGRFLIIDDDDNLRSMLKLHLFNIFPEAIFVECFSGDNALATLKIDSSFDGIFCDFEMDKGNGEVVYDYYTSYHSQIPFVLMSSKESFEGTSLSFLPRKRNEVFLKKPYSFEELRDVLYVLEDIGDNDDLGFRSILLPLFFRFDKTEFDIYLKLYDSKYVKILKKGDTYSREDLSKYIKKGLDRVFIRKENYNEFVECLYNKPLFQYTENESVEMRVKSIHYCLHEVILDVGISPNVVEEVSLLTENVLNSFESSNPLYNLLLKSIEETDYIYEHSYIIACFACSIESKLNWANRGSREKLVKASLLHDLTLDNALHASAQNLDSEILEGCNSKERLEFMDHPVRMKEMLDQSNNLSFNVSDIILQHHEKPDGSGFPRGLKANSISPLSKVFIVAHDFVSRYYKKGLDVNKLHNILDEMKGDYTERQFFEIYKALTDALD